MKPLLFAAAYLIAGAAGAAGSEPTDRPACRAADPRPLQFWLGVRDTAPAQAGAHERRRLRAVLDGCAISEHWSSAADAAAGGDGRATAAVRAASAVPHRRVATARTATLPI